MNAVKRGDRGTTDILLAHGADVNHLSPDHWTALAEAAQQGFHEIILSLSLVAPILKVDLHMTGRP